MSLFFQQRYVSVALAVDTRSKRFLTRRVLVSEQREGNSLFDRMLGLVSQGPSIRDQAYEGSCFIRRCYVLGRTQSKDLGTWSLPSDPVGEGSETGLVGGNVKQVCRIRRCPPVSAVHWIVPFPNNSYIPPFVFHQPAKLFTMLKGFSETSLWSVTSTLFL
jgi:hypothetical protein